MQRFYRNLFHYGPRTLPVVIGLSLPLLPIVQYSLVFATIYGGAWLTLFGAWAIALFKA
jgi:hypothetical protein